MVLSLSKYKYIIILFFLGFSSGLPLSLIYGTLSVWLNEAGIDKSSITFFSWATIGYSLKFVWSPLIDHISLPFFCKQFGQRRGWLLISQLAILVFIIIIALTDPIHHNQLFILAIASVGLGFSSATQDIIIDAYRIECTSKSEQGSLAASYTAGYRLALIIAGAFALVLSGFFGSSKGEYNYIAWRNTYLMMSLFMSLGVITTFIIKEPKMKHQTLNPEASKQFIYFFLFIIALIFSLNYLITMLLPLIEQHIDNQIILTGIHYLFIIISSYFIIQKVLSKKFISLSLVKKIYLSPIQEFWHRYPIKTAILLLLLIGLYRISDTVFGTAANIFYQDIGFSKLEIGGISKTFGITMTLLGSFLGAYLIKRFNLFTILMLGAALSAITNLLYITLSYIGHHVLLLTLIISFDNLSVGIASIAFIAFLSKITNTKFTATQYAIFTSIMLLLPKLIAGFSGQMINLWGYNGFFIFTTLIGLPVLILVYLVSKSLQPFD